GAVGCVTWPLERAAIGSALGANCRNNCWLVVLGSRRAALHRPRSHSAIAASTILRLPIPCGDVARLGLGAVSQCRLISRDFRSGAVGCVTWPLERAAIGSALGANCRNNCWLVVLGSRRAALHRPRSHSAIAASTILRLPIPCGDVARLGLGAVSQCRLISRDF